MFKLNDDAGLLIQLYSGIKSGETQLPVAKGLLESMFPAEEISKPPPSSSAGVDLLDIFSSPSTSTPLPQSSAPPPSSQSSAPPPTTQPAPRLIALAPPPPTPSRVLPTSLRQPQPAQAAPAVDIFGGVLLQQQAPASQPAAVSAPLSQPAVDIFGDPIKSAESDPFSARVSIDDILGHPAPGPAHSAPVMTAAPAPQPYPQYSPYPSATMAPSVSSHPTQPYDPFAPQPPPSGFPTYDISAPTPYHSPAPAPASHLDPFNSFAGLTVTPYQQPTPSHPVPTAAPPPPASAAAQSNNPFDLF
jgi:hypothetical protein